MTVADEARVVANVADLLAMVELDDINYYELSACREDTAVSEGDPVVEPIQIAERHAADRIEVRCSVEVQAAGARYRVDAAAQFLLPEPVVVPQAVMMEFVERVGVMAVYPYLREGLFGLATKLRQSPPVLGLLRANSVKVTTDRDEGAGSASR